MIEKIQAIRSLVGGAITQKYSGDVIYHDGQIPPTETEIQAKIAELEALEPMRLLRIERNRRLAETDWRMVEDYPMSNKLEWKTYRQALRDLPATQKLQLNENEMLTNITWPEVPNA